MKILPDAIRTNCSSCNEIQRKGAKKITNHLIKNKRSWWDELEAKYDPEGIFRKKYESELKNEGFEV
ncbi:hypothetical protein NQ314_018574 [Rhamnusium bicolor]|uniref:Uncharacterized protein n=1 Tax=Rhamnusium bicolor TaxID=1586634 RepID=A0AAV8WQL3_9CUCU|nr:hypothetical protein NQ314_018574 [Rhamnusium bicolor]